jgi:hypothetical protein
MARPVAFSYSYDWNHGEGRGVRFSDRFTGESGLMRADVLKDAVYDVTAAYNDAVEAMRAEFVDMAARSPHQVTVPARQPDDEEKRDCTPVFGPESALGLVMDMTSEIERAVKKTPQGQPVVHMLVNQYDVDALRWMLDEIAKTWVR